jgi:hypothetical protein
VSQKALQNTILVLVGAALAAVALLATRGLYDWIEDRQNFEQNYAQVVFFALVPLALAAAPAFAWRSVKVLVALSAVAALGMAGYTANHLADPLRYDNSVALVRSVLVFTGSMSFALGMLLPLAAAFVVCMLQTRRVRHVHLL